MATKDSGPEKAAQPPRVVLLANGEAHRIVVGRLQRMLAVLHLDPKLELGPATGGLLGSGADLILRLNTYKEYPFFLAFLCRR